MRVGRNGLYFLQPHRPGREVGTLEGCFQGPVSIRKLRAAQFEDGAAKKTAIKMLSDGIFPLLGTRLPCAQNTRVCRKEMPRPADDTLVPGTPQSWWQPDAFSVPGQ